jgi:hypothetical protein
VALLLTTPPGFAPGLLRAYALCPSADLYRTCMNDAVKRQDA